MKNRLISLALVLILAISIVPSSAYASELGNFSLLEFIPDTVTLGFPTYATIYDDSTSDMSAFRDLMDFYLETELVETPIGQKILQTTLDITRGKTTEYDKAKAISDWIYANISYDYELLAYREGTIPHLPEGVHWSTINWEQGAVRVFEERKGVCEGYTNLSMLMLFFADIPGVFCSGISRPNNAGVSGDHAWSLAIVDGRRIYFDSTWGVFGMPYNYHSNVRSVQFADGYIYNYVSSHSMPLEAVGIPRVPSDVTEITLPGGYACYYTYDRFSSGHESVRKITFPGNFIYSEQSRLLSGFINVEEIVFASGTTQIPPYMFSGSSKIKEFDIPNTVTKIGDHAFYYCTALTYITIPSSVSEIGENAFANCPDLTIYGSAGSYAETYANANSIPFIAGTPLDSAAGWARPEIASAIEKGFVPPGIRADYRSAITRLDFCRMAVRFVEYATGKNIDAILAENEVSRDPKAFTDTSDSDILAAFALGITTGTGNNRFAPDGQIRREEAATMLMRACRVIGMDTGNPPASDFTDIDSTPNWARDGINFCRANGIMGSTNSATPIFSPKGTYSRQDSIATFDRIK